MTWEWWVVYVALCLFQMGAVIKGAKDYSKDKEVWEGVVFGIAWTVISGFTQYCMWGIKP
jgi:hypothetical protein